MSKIMPREQRLEKLRAFYYQNSNEKWTNSWHRPSEMYAGMRYLEECRISLLTARRDLDILVEEGMLERRLDGKGWFYYYEYRIKQD